MPDRPFQHVVVGAIFNGVNEILLAFRPPTAPRRAGTHKCCGRRMRKSSQGGLWEFPGGKVEAGESARQALARELQEELGISVVSARPLIRIRHHYHESLHGGRSRHLAPSTDEQVSRAQDALERPSRDVHGCTSVARSRMLEATDTSRTLRSRSSMHGEKIVLLNVWRVDAFAGEPFGREGQPVEWVAIKDLIQRDYPAANWPIVNAVRLPSRYLITPEPSPNTQEFLYGLERSLRAGIRLVQLRAKTLSETAYVELARQVLPVCHAHQAQLILNAAPALVEEVGADGVHLDSARLMSLSARPFSSSRLWVGASCHNAKELAHAGRLGADFAVVSPVLETTSHPGARTLGWTGFRELTELAVLPVYALGGMTQRHVTQAYEHGAQGIAGVSSLWRD